VIKDAICSLECHISGIVRRGGEDHRRQNLFSWFLSKIIKIVETRCRILQQKCTQFDFGWGSLRDSLMGELTMHCRAGIIFLWVFQFLVPPSATTCLSTSHLRRHSRFSDNDSRPFFPFLYIQRHCHVTRVLLSPFMGTARNAESLECIMQLGPECRTAWMPNAGMHNDKAQDA